VKRKKRKKGVRRVMLEHSKHGSASGAIALDWCLADKGDDLQTISCYKKVEKKVSLRNRQRCREKERESPLTTEEHTSERCSRGYHSIERVTDDLLAANRERVTKRNNNNYRYVLHQGHIERERERERGA
jgi:hypothetical protein